MKYPFSAFSHELIYSRHTTPFFTIIEQTILTTAQKKVNPFFEKTKKELLFFVSMFAFKAFILKENFYSLPESYRQNQVRIHPVAYSIS